MGYIEYFESKQIERSQIIILKKEAPENLKGLIKSIHSYFYDCLPNNWIYSTIYEAFIDLEKEENINIEADIYYHQILNWLYENGTQYAIQYCEDAKESYGCLGFMEILSEAQKMAKINIYREVEFFLIDQFVESTK